MAWTGQATDDEMKSVLNAISTLEQRPYIRHMSYDMIAKATYKLKDTAVRWIIAELEKKAFIIKLRVGEQKVPRYFYKLTDAGKAFLGAE